MIYYFLTFWWGQYDNLYIGHHRNTFFWNEILTQSGRKTYISFNSQFWKMQQKLPKWAKSIKPCWNEAILILFAPKCFVEFSVKSLMPFEVIQKYWKLKEKQFLPLGGVMSLVISIHLVLAQKWREKWGRSGASWRHLEAPLPPKK